ncbi:MAG: hypothetical protein JNM59_03745 [Hyphomonadaceae bacterium]|nr:hypothetical protein [Hyphomonadaceae bacterium]
MRALLLASMVALAGCAGEPRVDLSNIPACASYEPSRGALEPGACKLEANGETLHVKFAATPEGSSGGVVSVDVVSAEGDVRQVLIEENVSEYLTPSVQDIDGDGRGDLLLPRESGNVNLVSGVWVFSGDGLYRRAGEVSGVAVARTDEGLIAVPARGSAASWNVTFHQLDEGGLRLIASVDVEAQEAANGALTTRCSLADAPGLEIVHLSTEQAETKFCAEPATTGVFRP